MHTQPGGLRLRERLRAHGVRAPRDAVEKRHARLPQREQIVAAIRARPEHRVTGFQRLPRLGKDRRQLTVLSAPFFTRYIVHN